VLWVIALLSALLASPAMFADSTRWAHDHWLQRSDERTLEVDIVDGALLEGPLESLFRPESAPLRAGDRLPLGAWTVQILQEISGRPTRFAVLFDRPLDDPSLSFLIWKNGGLRALVVPRVGQRVHVKHEPGPIGHLAGEALKSGRLARRGALHRRHRALAMT
jgi:hypothetical protein